MHRLWALGFVTALVTAAPAASTVTGTWTMAVDAGPHGQTSMGLVLVQDGHRVTGTLSTPHGDMRVEGTFAEGKLQLRTQPDGGKGEPITLSASLKSNGTLEGYLSSEMGDMTWTAERVQEKR